MNIEEKTKEEQMEIINLLLFCVFTNAAEGAYWELEDIARNKYYKHEIKHRINMAYKQMEKAIDPIRNFYNEDAMNTENKLTNLVYEVAGVMLGMPEHKRIKIRDFIYEIADKEGLHEITK